MTNAYLGREQTQAKHFILKHYLQELAFKVLTFSDVSYIDGFSGPWETKTENFSDSSFMIALNVLRDAQENVYKITGKLHRIRCFFSEISDTSFAQLQNAVAPFHKPDKKFEIKTYCGKFEDAVEEIETFIEGSLPLIFIDPTGWTGFSLNKIQPLFAPQKCEVLINFMYDHINRFSNSDDKATIASLEAVLGKDWPSRLDNKLPRGLAAEKLFRERLQMTGSFEFVVSTRIDKATAERPHFFIVYGTKNINGLKAFRETEYRALKEHAKNTESVREKKKSEKSQMGDLFSKDKIDRKEASIDELVYENKGKALNALLEILKGDKILSFEEVIKWALPAYMLRETDIKDICLELARDGKIKNTWSVMNKKKPYDRCVISLVS